MEYIQQEINEHKAKLMTLINNLINTQLINQEFFINSEIKKESECLNSLLNVKQKTLMNPMNMINNPFILQQNQILNVSPLNMNPFQEQIIKNNNIENNNGKDRPIVGISFHHDFGKKIHLDCIPNEKVYEVIKKYRERANDYGENTFSFNGKIINCNSNQTLIEIGMKLNPHNIVYVSPIGVLKGGKIYANGFICNKC